MQLNRLLPASAASLLLVCLPFSSKGQNLDIANMPLTSPTYEAEAAKLRAMPSRPYEFSKAMLGDVIRFMATDAGISFFSLPDGSPEADKLITFSLNASPFQALETLCKANQLALVIDGGIWYVRPADDKELIGKAYTVKHNSFERVSKVNSGSSAGGTSSSSYGGSGSATGGAGGVQSGGVDLQGATETFRTERSELIDDIREILDLGPGGIGGGAGMASPIGAPAPVGGEATAVPSGVPMDIYGNVRKPKIIWKSDSNTLYVVATRLQHMWVEGLLAATDLPQALIAIEIKFFETSKDPIREFGVDWTGTFGQTGTFRQVDTVETDPTTGQTTVTTNNIPNTEGGFRGDLSNLLSLANLAETAAAINPPMQAVLSAQDVNIKLRAMLRDEETETVSYPRMVVTNNREVVIRNVENKPVLGGSTNANSGGGSTTSSAISYLPIGTVINILPKKMEGDKIRLNMSITLSSIIGTEVIAGEPYPIATSRVYDAPVEVNSGYTVAVGGLDEARERKGTTGIPFLSKIPLLGHAFKTNSKAKNHKNLMFFVTPTLINPNDGGLPDEPTAVTRRKPDALMPQMPRLDDNGTLQGGIEGLPNAVAFLKRSTDELGLTIKENRGTKEDYGKIFELQRALTTLEEQVESYMKTYPDRWEELRRYKWQIDGLHDEAARHRRLLMKKGYY
jgi:type II secretory pathway component GspD/PulD (secretin)